MQPECAPKSHLKGKIASYYSNVWYNLRENYYNYYLDGSCTRKKYFRLTPNHTQLAKLTFKSKLTFGKTLKLNSFVGKYLLMDFFFCNISRMFRNINKNSYLYMPEKTNLKNFLCRLIDQKYRNFRPKKYRICFRINLMFCWKKHLKSTTLKVKCARISI